jgi:hypothetical protein
MESVACYDIRRERTVIDAFKDLVEGRIEETAGLPCTITRLSERPKGLANGIAYCFAEVSFPNGVQYGIEAFGDEAHQLYEAARYVSKGQEHRGLRQLIMTM